MRIKHLVTTAAAALAAAVVVAAPASADPSPQFDPGIDYVAIELLSIYCNKNSEGGHDEAYLNMDGGKVWPRSVRYQTMGAGYTRSMTDANGIDAFRIPVYEERGFSLWDYDSTSGDDALGSFAVRGDEVGTTQTKRISGSGGSYTVTYRVVDVP
ncbi:hypothetical protein [Sinosporangium siamense]|uniref:Secreted protein n=1 Tax=Sinosporangium siamense TaxID=1367973 RepID=A0A919RHY4_9ACTN|nr:hypothetical protein [Sinosporangium siamense]GII94102.1 hypothetical protein Ssi02_43330 [Sinosporangium siamense]